MGSLVGVPRWTMELCDVAVAVGNTGVAVVAGEGRRREEDWKTGIEEDWRK